MNATFLKRWTAWLLPLLVLRAFIPVGFMLGSGPQGLQLMFCPGVVQGAGDHSAASAHGAGSREHSQHGDSGNSHEQHQHAPCPYGLVGATASTESIHVAVTGVINDDPIALPSTPLLDRSPIRAEPIRGPPLSSLKALI